MSDLHTKVRQWLNEEGYPLEFMTAAIFKRYGFIVRQGTYVREKDIENVREIDVVAYKDSHSNGLIRVYHVIECKWSKDKPWVIFTGSGSMAFAACISQTISSLLGGAILWTKAGLEELHTMNLFSTPRRAGFNGRQAFSKGNDIFYNSLKSVTTLSTLLMQEYDHESRPVGVLPDVATVAFPVIVVDGKLFEAYFDSETNDLRLEETMHVRCHWKGAPSWRFHATIDVVSLEHLDTFVKQRQGDVQHLLDIMGSAQQEIAMCFARKSLDKLEITKGPRGTLGLPKLLREVMKAQKQLEGQTNENES